MKRIVCIIMVGVCICCVSFCFAQKLSRYKLKMSELPELSYPVTGIVFQLSHTWKVYDGDNKEYSKKDFNDSNWKNIEVGEEVSDFNLPEGSLTVNGLSAMWRWYRVTFNLPENLEGKDLLLDIAIVSLYDEVYVNGVQIGHFGNPSLKIYDGNPFVRRKYPIASKYFHSGHNILAVRVKPGEKGGLYQGNYTLQALKDDAIVGKMQLKTGGNNALERLLIESPYLSTFASGSKLLVEPNLTQLFGAPRRCQIVAKIKSQNRIIDQKTTVVSVDAMQWTPVLFQFKTPVKGDYLCELSVVADGEIVWNKKLPFHVGLPSLKFNSKVDTSLNRFNDQTLPVQISQLAMGHFGPREVNEKFELFDDLEKTDARSGLAYSVQIFKSLGAPRLFLANTRPVPVDAGSQGRFHRVAGHEFDGFKDAWIYGFIRPNGSAIKELSIKGTSWAKRTYHYEYQDNSWMDFSISAISPAWQATSNAPKMRVFEEIERHGIGLPTYLAYQGKSGMVKVVNAKTGVQGSDMGANWILAWFNGGKGWDEFDTPYLFVLQNRPESVHCYSYTALTFSYPKTVGSIQGMPLYGVTLQNPDQTADWIKGLPTDVLARCRYWSRVLVNAPDQVRRTAKVDYSKDQLTVKDEFSYLDIQDAWETKGIKIAPVGPMLALAASSGNINIVTNIPTKDLEMATLQGPLVAADKMEKMIFRINGMLHYIQQVRKVKKSDNAEVHQVQEQLDQIIESGLNADLKNHPWAKTYGRQELMPGLQQRSYTNLLLTLPYLNPSLRSAVEKEIKEETDKYFLYSGIPGPELASHLKPALRDIPAITVLTNRVNGLKLGVTALSNTFGIDQPFWTSVTTYMAWLYAYTFDRFNWIRQNYPTLKRYFNLVRNSHDWDTNVSWDTFSGLRVGNGLQEGGGKYAGAVAMSRIAKKMGDQTTSDQAAYYAVMEAVGLCGQTSATRYLKQRRPWLASNTMGEGVEFAQELKPYNYAEFNEFDGISQVVIYPYKLIYSTGSFILSPLPEVMRLYQEVWPNFTNDFFNPKYDSILHIDRRLDWRTSMDVFVYMLTKYPQTLQQLFDVRKILNMDWWDKLPDYRGYLDSLGEITYTNLW